jgi:hypothetical protein
VQHGANDVVELNHLQKAGSLYAQRNWQHGGVALVETDDAGRICVDNFVQGIDREQQLLAWFAKQECIAAVVRPDGYVFGIARTSRDIDALLIDLKSQLRD